MTRRSDPNPHLLIRIDLDGTGGETWREITIDGRMRLTELSDAIIIAFGWTGTGSHAFGVAPARWWTDRGAGGELATLRPLGDRDPRPASWREYDRFSDIQLEIDCPCEHAWSIADALDRSGGALAFAYHQRDVVSGGRDTGRTWLHHIRSLDRADRPSSPHPAMIIAGSGLVPRDLAEHAYGELGDPTNLQLLASEFAVRFGRPSSNALGFETGDWPALSSALAGSSIAARRALRMDLVELGLLSSADVEPEVAEHVTAPIRDALGAAATPDGVDAAALGTLGDDLRALRLVRIAKSRLHTVAEVRNRVMNHPVSLWHQLASRTMRLGSGRYGWSARPEIAEFAVDLFRVDREVRVFAFDEAHLSRPSSGSIISEIDRARRILGTMGLVDEHGIGIHPAARTFGGAMLRS